MTECLHGVKNCLSSLLLLLILILPGARYVHAEGVSAERLEALSRTAQWSTLLHFDSQITHLTPRSRASSSDFFLSEEGYRDPLEELRATVAALQAATPEDDSHAACRFPARALWLKREAGLMPGIDTEKHCARFRQWFQSISPRGVTLIFPASFVNNPASAFGHTFLRLDHDGEADDTKLLDYAADFAAATHGENALVYAIKGIFGGFDGFYSVAPFYKKVEKYSDLENRDIWEYHLNLNADETSMLVSHLWELREHPFSYFYFDENCSYHVLALLDVARPSLQLINAMRLWVIPVDTIRELAVRAGVIDRIVFRPSAATKLRSRIAVSSTEEQQAALKAVDLTRPVADAINQLDSPEKRAKSLDLGYEYLTYQRIRNRSDSPEEKQRSWELLAARSQQPQGAAPVFPEPEVRPEAGHRTGMFSIGAGRSEDRDVAEFVFRPAFHSLIDPQGGYLPGNQIKFLETAARYTEGRGFELNRLTALDIKALTPRDRFFKPMSWHVNLTYQQFQRELIDPLGLAGLTAGGGRSYQLADSLLGYAMIDGAVEYSSMLNRDHALGAGPRAGVIFSPAEGYASELSYADHWFFSGDSHREQRGTIAQRVTLAGNLTLRVEVDYTNAFQNSYWTSMIRLERFFTP